MTIYVKLTNADGTTRGGTKWAPGVVHKTSGENDLCGPGWLHCYGADTVEQASLLAAFLNPVHGQFEAPRLWLAECGGQMLSDHGLKFGFTEMGVVEELPLPNITTTQKVAFGILCVKQVHAEPRWNEWADNWLSGKDRTAASAARAASAAMAWASAESPVRSAELAARAASAAWAWASWASEEASWVAEEAARAGKELNLGAIAAKSMGY